MQNSASIVYDLIAAEWDTSVCGGGGKHLRARAKHICSYILTSAVRARAVWWSSAHTYKNAITNELFLYISASGYNRFGNSTYLANAQKVRLHMRVAPAKHLLTLLAGA